MGEVLGAKEGTISSFFNLNSLSLLYQSDANKPVTPRVFSGEKTKLVPLFS